MGLIVCVSSLISLSCACFSFDIVGVLSVNVFSYYLSCSCAPLFIWEKFADPSNGVNIISHVTRSAWQRIKIHV